jgi:beta-phosphoglucomutase-like phosphatase (HAD superfamily)
MRGGFSMVNNIKSVIFDMDGVLIEAKDWHYEALNKALGLFGIEISRYDHLVTYDGLPTKKKLEMLSIERGLPRGLHEFINTMKQQYTMEIIYAKCKPVFYHQFALSRLKSEGYKLAVCSNSVKNTIEVMMEKAKLMEYLEFFLSNQDVVKGKPDPEMYNKAIALLGYTPKECLIVEDNENGIKAARASGAYVLEVNEVTDVTYQTIMNRIIEIGQEVNHA